MERQNKQSAKEAKEQAKQAAEAAKRQATEEKLKQVAEQKAARDAAEQAKREAKAARQMNKTGDLNIGVVEFTVVPPTDILRVKQLENCLRNIPGLRVVMCGGSLIEGTNFVVSLREPISLKSVLEQQPPVEHVGIDKKKKITVKLKPVGTQ
jgi:multidrug efflux pump subunit AcrA (membrane-fusion protein)